MSKRSIIILIVCTFIIVTVSITSINREPEISGIYLTDIEGSDDYSTTLREEKIEFSSLAGNIFLVIQARYLDIEDSVKVNWIKISGNSMEIVQKNSITPENKGSGELVLSLIKRNNQYYTGKYKVDVYLNDHKKYEKYFLIIQE